MTTHNENRNPEAVVDSEGLLARLSRPRVLVIGDLFLDEYIEGRATRLSREAPVPVLEFERRIYRPGGGTNPAHNIVALGARAIQAGVIGDDPAGQQLAAELIQAGIDTAGVVVDASRPTTTKTRVISRGSLRFPQQLARIDRLDRRPIDADIVAQIEAHIRAGAAEVDAILISDYRTGVVTPAIIAAALDAAHTHGRLITVDSQGNLARYRGVDLVKCNQAEAEAALGRSVADQADVQSACEELLDALGVGAVVITRGAHGMAGLSRREGFVMLPAANQTEVYDVVGAGDTAIAVLTLALAAGLPFATALQLANYAAGLVVRKLGNATATPAELQWAMTHW
jgi:D-glycero-beta-D-manno-heptose-7-phosphate kinase